jgi:putative endonuclease
MSETEKQKIGKIGENFACEFLENKGFKIKDRNYRKPWGEIDVIAEKGNDLRFVEVKTVTRNDNSHFLKDNYEPEDNIHPWKLKRLGRAIETYLLEKRIGDETDWQLDALSVYLNPAGELINIELLEDLW